MIDSGLRLVAQAINEALESDSANHLYLSELGEVRIQICSETPEFTFEILVQDGLINLHVPQQPEGTEPDIAVSGTAISLAKLVVQPVENAADLRRSNIRVQGDVALLLELSQLSGKLEIDWEALLAQRLGETPAVLISRGLKGAKRFSEDVASQQRTKLEEWLKQPDSPVVNREEYDQLKSKLRDLQYRLDRLEARVKSESERSAEEHN